MTEMNLENSISLIEAAAYAHVTRHAIYAAVVKKRLFAKKIGRQWFTTRQAIDEYRLSKFNRDNLLFEGKLVHNIEEGFFSPLHIAKLFSEILKKYISRQKIYHLLRTGQIKAFRKGPAWVISKEAACEYLDKKQEKYDRQMSML
jgi:hypothetical protein